MTRRLGASTLIFSLLFGGACAKSSDRAASSDARSPAQAAAPASPEQQLKQAQRLLQTSRYAEAARGFEALLKSPVKQQAALGLSEVYLVTGRTQEALEVVQPLSSSGDPWARQAALIQARAQRLQGNLQAAEALLRPLIPAVEARAARLLLGEILLERDQREAAEAVLMTLIEDYNEGRISDSDGPELAMVGRAAHLLRSPHDANDAFNLAEQAQQAHVPTLLWRAELFLEKHDPGHAEQVVREVLEVAPQHPDALVWLANVRLEQALDFDEAERLARQALAVNPKHTRAHVVLAGVALRDMELELADQRVNQGLEQRHNDLELLSMRAAVRFLEDDRAGFEQATRAVLTLHSHYSRVYQIVGEYAEWEHRYDEIVKMMEQAVRIDPGDANAHAKLGLNLIRAGEDDAGIISLRTAFELDPFNVRVFNTLNLYEKVIKEDYVSVERGKFRIRYPRAEQALLDRYVPDLLDQAFRQMVEHYGFEPDLPIGIELYARREHFSVRTSGLPRTAIQGVCFGRTLASMSLSEEKFNLGMTLWHELAHVFHIQLSKYHVPRWFTEGLAEYETLIERSEWSREHDPELFEALRGGRIPEVASMSRAFTRAEQVSDVATAYYASAQILTMLVEQHGMGKMRGLLAEWGAGARTPDALRRVLGVSAAQLDTDFRRHTKQRLVRYGAQFVPRLRAEALDKVKAELQRSPEDPDVLYRLALSLWQTGAGERAAKLVAEVLKKRPQAADALYLSGRMALEQDQAARAEHSARRLLELGQDGYWTQLLLGRALISQERFADARAALMVAQRFDPTQSEPLMLLHGLAHKLGQADIELEVLEKLAALEQHDGAFYSRLFELLTERGRHQDVVRLADAALWADLSSFDIHYLLAQALKATGDAKRARFELESAALCEAPPARKVEAHLALLESYRAAGAMRQAREQAERVRELDPKHPGLEKLGL